MDGAADTTRSDTSPTDTGPADAHAAAPTEVGGTGASRYSVALRPGERRDVTHPARPDISLLDVDWNADPLDDMAWLRAHAPVFWDEGTGIWGIATHADVMAVESDWETFNSSGGSRPTSSVPSMINTDPPEHSRRRLLVSLGFTPRRVARHEAFLRSTVTELIDAVVDDGTCDFVADIARSVPLRMIATLMGLPLADEEQLLRWSDLFATGGEEIRDEVVAAVTEYAAYIVARMAERTDPDADDLISLLMYADGDRFSTDDLVFETMLILVGGDETTRHVMSGGLDALMRHPDQLEALRRDRSTLPVAIEEMLRWTTPVRNMTRTATRDVELRGQTIREGDKVLLLYQSANRDEAVFERPDAFDTTRDPNPHVAFGGKGRHFCLGAQLARLELRVLFEEVLRRFPDVRHDDPLAAPHERRGNFVLGLESLPISWG